MNVIIKTAKNSELTELDRAKFFLNNSYTVNDYNITLFRRQYSEDGELFRCARIFSPIDGVDIYFVGDGLESKDDDFTIQTTSWGALTISEMEKVMERYRIAMETVKWLNAFDWNKTDILFDNL